ncbi:hypothetical protein [Streptomyces sp. URMC 123]|uniref:hypothetical protein n=1 Tax=Streptomyces sp. URMC 123 TaxID=3423403 RepID=UPI003F1BA25D
MSVLPEITKHHCKQCGAEAFGTYGRYACTACGYCSPYMEPPEGWQSDDAEEAPAGGGPL